MSTNDWTEAENRAIVSAYFEMLDNELTSVNYSCRLTTTIVAGRDLVGVLPAA